MIREEEKNTKVKTLLGMVNMCCLSIFASSLAPAMWRSLAFNHTKTLQWREFCQREVE